MKRIVLDGMHLGRHRRITPDAFEVGTMLWIKWMASFWPTSIPNRSIEEILLVERPFNKLGKIFTVLAVSRNCKEKNLPLVSAYVLEAFVISRDELYLFLNLEISKRFEQMVKEGGQ